MFPERFWVINNHGKLEKNDAIMMAKNVKRTKIILQLLTKANQISSISNNRIVKLQRLRYANNDAVTEEQITF